MYITRKGSVFVSHLILREKGAPIQMVTQLYPVYHMIGMMVRLLSVGEFLQQGFSMTGDHKRLAFYSARSKALTLACYPHAPDQTIYWLKAQITSADSLLAKSTVYTVDYDLIHH